MKEIYNKLLISNMCYTISIVYAKWSKSWDLHYNQLPVMLIDNGSTCI